MTKWACFYEKDNNYDSENLYNYLNKGSKAFGLKIAEPEWIEMRNNPSSKDRKYISDGYFGTNKIDFNFQIVCWEGMVRYVPN